MSAKNSKVKYNIQKCHYAVKTADGTYSTPIAMPGAVSLSLEQQGELTPFWADGVKYYVSASNGGYEGDLEIAILPDQFRKDVLGETEDSNKVLFENAHAATTEFALGFQVDGDAGPTLFWFYNCTATRPNVTANTTADTTEPVTDVLTISCASSADGTVRAKTTAATIESVMTGWFNEVYVENQETA